MSTITVWKFESETGAAEAAEVLTGLARQHALDIHDAATVTWHAGRSKPTTRHLHELAGRRALGGAFWGFLFGMVFFVPLLGAALGAATGALTGSLRDIGMDDEFINRVRDEVTPGTSAIFVMSSAEVTDTIRDAFAGHQHGSLVFSNLSSEQETALRAVFGE